MNSETLVGRVVHPTNRHYATGIHDNETAQAAGFRGGTIAGSAHLDTLVPLALALFGEDWFRSGSLSLTFRFATTDGEPTYASIDKVGEHGQHAARIETPEGVLVGVGTVGAPGALGPTHLFSDALQTDSSKVRILRSVSAGDPIGPATDMIDGKSVHRRSADGLITEPVAWYSRNDAPSSPWGAQIVPPSAVIDSVNRVVSDQLAQTLPPAVGMWSALEVRFLNGPVVADIPHRIEGSVAAIGESPKTEIIWQDCTMYNGAIPIASVRIQSRFVKSTSDLWSAD